MKAKVYIETTVVSYQTGRPSRDIVVAAHQQATLGLWERLGSDFQPFVSALVVKEARAGDPEMAANRMDAIDGFPIIQTTAEAEALAERIIAGNAVPAEHPEDALHIALAVMGGVDFLATWNFSHINNPFTRMMIRRIVESQGYVCPEIVSPDELLGDES